MEKTVENQACSSPFCFFRPSLLCFAVLVLSLVFTCFFSSGFSPFLVTISVLILSTLFLVTFSRKTVTLPKNPAQDENIIHDQENMVAMDIGGKLEPIMEETVAQEITTEIDRVHESPLGSIDIQLENESGDDESVTSEDFELSWMCNDNVGQSPATSDGSISGDDDDDDDNLIEIAIPGRPSVKFEGGGKQKAQSNLPESILQEDGLMELLADINEMNEEENLIEIDISMGVFKV